MLVFAPAAFRAAETWLRPEHPAATPGARLEFELVTAEVFGAPAVAVSPERVARVVGRLAGAAVATGELRAAENALRIETTLVRPGVAVVGVELKPRRLEIGEDRIEAYFRSLGAGEDLRAAWEALPPPRVWRELVWRNAKAFVRVGEPVESERGWSEPLGTGVEIVAERDPTSLRAGDELPVRVVRGAGAVAGFALTFVSQGGAREHVRVTDGEGRARAKLDLPGNWLVHGGQLRRVVSADRDWESDFTALLVQAAP